MGVRKYRPTSAGRRDMSVSDFDTITKSTPEKKLSKGLTKSGGRNSHGRITARRRGGGHKRRYRQIDFKRMREIADMVGAYLQVDMAHFAGLVAAGEHPSPFPHAHVATTTTHKTLRGPRGGMILTNDEALAKKFNSAIFPGIQGGPLMHVIAAKAVAFGEALKPEFKTYIQQVIKNAQALSDQLIKGGLDTITHGTDTHLLLVDLRPKGVKGNDTEKALGRAHITCNKNGVPFDPEKPMVTSGIRLGSPAATTRGFGEAEFRQIADWIIEVVDGLAANGADGNAEVEAKVKAEVEALCARFPIYPNL